VLLHQAVSIHAKESFGDEISNAIIPMSENAAQLDNSKAGCEKLISRDGTLRVRLSTLNEMTVALVQDDY